MLRYLEKQSIYLASNSYQLTDLNKLFLKYIPLYVLILEANLWFNTWQK